MNTQRTQQDWITHLHHRAAMVDAANAFADTARALGVLKADALRYLDAAFE